MKIGFSATPAQWLRQLQTGLSRPVDMWLVVKGTNARAGGEWFVLSQPVTNTILRLARLRNAEGSETEEE